MLNFNLRSGESISGAPRSNDRRLLLVLAAAALLRYPAGIAAQPADLNLQATREAAESGNSYQQFNLGLAYDKGTGVAQDSTEAAAWYRKAAEQGLAVAQYNLGVKYEKGEGVAQDASVAVQWYRKAAEQGYARAQVNLGVKYATGDGVPKDLVLAHLWFRFAAEQGDAPAADNVARAEKLMTPDQLAAAQTLFEAWAPRIQSNREPAQ